MKPYADLQIVEVAEQRIPENPSALEIEQALQKEGEQIAKLIPLGSYVIPLAIAGERLSSEELSGFIDRLLVEGKSKIVFIIGSSYGISPEILEKVIFALVFTDDFSPSNDASDTTRANLSQHENI